ncbi:MAG: CBS domain-containing protein [Xanthomonadales bacterium]|nr:CBS domain-containing protein [Xanthomonadales bacterium]
MDLLKFANDTAVARPGMKVRELFRECIRADVPGIPYRDASGEIVGKASMRYVMRESCIPEFMIRHARLLGERVDALAIPEEKAMRMLDKDVAEFVFSDFAVITPNSSMTKALAVMEKHDTTYLFLVDENHQYHGTITIMHIAARLMEEYD